MRLVQNPSSELQRCQDDVTTKWGSTLWNPSKVQDFRLFIYFGDLVVCETGVSGFVPTFSIKMCDTADVLLGKDDYF